MGKSKPIRTDFSIVMVNPERSFRLVKSVKYENVYASNFKADMIKGPFFLP